jgi:topoisomerase (DNA) II binding protein 1
VTALPGQWILRPDYLTASEDASGFLDERPYQWGAQKAAKGDAKLWAGAGMRWKQHAEAGGAPPFAGWKVRQTRRPPRKARLSLPKLSD